MSHWTEQYSKNNLNWNTEKPPNAYVGGTFKVSNLSGGYHGLLKQWWEHYFSKGKVLLISESEKVKKEFKELYPHWEIKTTDFQDESTDILVDICSKDNPFKEKFDLIINQATLEHLYNPFKAMENLIESLNPNGIIISHTHPPRMAYHQYPRDYFRFMKDWWFDLPNYINGIVLEEFFMYENNDVFTLYKKTS
jgi:SAM-dependent methyltransferase